MFLTISIIAVCFSCGDSLTNKPKQSGFTEFLDNVNDLLLVNADTTLSYISKVEKQYAIPADTLHWARACAYSVSYDVEKEKAELLAIVDSTQLDKSKGVYLKALDRLSWLCATNREQEKAMRLSLMGDSLANEYGDRHMRSQFKFNMGACTIHKDLNRGIGYVKESIAMCNEIGDSTAQRSALKHTVYLMNAYVMKQMYKECIEEGEKVAHAFDSLQNAGVRLEALDPTRSIPSNAYAILCISYCAMQRYVDAKIAYGNSTRYEGKSSITMLLQTYCLLRMNRADDAYYKYLALRDKYEADGDTISVEYINCIGGLAEIDKLRQDYKAALDHMEHVVRLRKMLYNKQIDDKYSEWEAKYNNQEQKIALAESQIAARRTRVILFAMGIALLAVVIVLVVSLNYGRALGEKNRAMAMHINDMLDKNGNASVEREPSSATAMGNNLIRESSGNSKESKDGEDEEAVTQEVIDDVKRFISELKERQLFKDVNFKRDDLLTELGITKRSFPHDFEMVVGKPFPKYLSVLRVEYAAEQIRKYPNYTIEYIASQSGVSSRATFYRFFTDYFGITPTEYRRQCLSMTEK